MGLGGRGDGGDRDLANKGLRAEAAGKNCGVCRRESDIRYVYRCIEDGGIYHVP